MYHSIDVNIIVVLNEKINRLSDYKKSTFNEEILNKSMDTINEYYKNNQITHESILNESKTNNTDDIDSMSDSISI